MQFWKLTTTAANDGKTFPSGYTQPISLKFVPR